MKSKNKKTSIFNIESLMAKNNAPGFLEDIELISENKLNRHVLSKNINFDDICTPKNKITELVKKGFNLPKADIPEKMLISTEENARDEDDTIGEKNTFKIADLISKSYNLPDISQKDFLK